MKAAPEPARERIYNFVREQILRGILPGGSFVEEVQISTAMGVSRTPVREAFHRLEAERFIELLPRRGALVRQVTAEELVQLYETRRLIEGDAIEQICRGRLPLVDMMLHSIEGMETNGGVLDLFAHVEFDRAFHRSIVASAGNVVTTELYDGLGARQQRVAMAALMANPSRMTRIVSEHRDIFNHLQAYDFDRAKKVLQDHLQPIVEVISRLKAT